LQTRREWPFVAVTIKLTFQFVPLYRLSLDNRKIGSNLVKSPFYLSL
jgi:hypothetical protein